MIIVFLLAFSATLFAVAIGGAKMSKMAREAKMKQDLEIYNKINNNPLKTTKEVASR